MSDADGLNAASRCNVPVSSSQGDDRHHYQPVPAAILPDYSQQPIDGIDTRAEMPSILFVDPSPTASSRPPPKYEHPPPYAVDYTPGRDGDVSEVRIHRVPESSASAIRREFLRARSPASSSHTPYIVLACIVFWLCGCVFGTVALILAVLARRKSPSQGQRLIRASFWVSVCGIIVGILLLLFFVPFLLNSPSFCGTVWKDDWNNTHVYWRPRTTASPEVTSPPCYVVENGTACFRFASSFKAELCSKVDGVVVNISSSPLSSLPPPLAASTASVVCYHNVCSDHYIIETSCFQYRTTQLHRAKCQGLNGYYVLEPSGRSCYYNDCPRFETSNNKCYQNRLSIAAAGCKHGFYEKGYCFYNSVP